MDEARLIDKLRLIEALFSGAGTEGERIAAERARERILERLKLYEREAPPIEFRFTMVDMWTRKVFVALLRRYGIRPYRYSGQRYTTVMARVSKRFVDETLWPEFQQISDTLRSYLSDVTDRVVGQVIHQDSSEAEVIEQPKELPPGVTVDAPSVVKTASVPASASAPTPAPAPAAEHERERERGHQPSPVGQAEDVSSRQSKNRNRNKRKRKQGRRGR